MIPGVYEVTLYAKDSAGRSVLVAKLALEVVGFATPPGWDPRAGWGNSTTDRVLEAGITYDVAGVLDSADAASPFVHARGELTFEAEVA